MENATTSLKHASETEREGKNQNYNISKIVGEKQI